MLHAAYAAGLPVTNEPTSTQLPATIRANCQRSLPLLRNYERASPARRGNTALLANVTMIRHPMMILAFEGWPLRKSCLRHAGV